LVGSQNAVREIAAGVADLGAGYIALQKSGFELSNGVRAWMYGCKDIYSALRIDKELLAAFPEIQKEYKDVHILGGWSNPGLYWVSTSSRPVRSVADMKGLTMKSSSWVAQLQAMGCAPVAVPMPESYMSLQKGIIDSVMAPMETMYGYKLAEVTKYHTSLGLAQGSQPELLFNLNRWNSLPASVQQILETTIPYGEEELAKAVIAMETEGIDECKKQGGHEFITLPQEELDKFYEIMNTVSIKEAAALDAKGLPGTKLFNEARRLIELYN
jgi:TRAP-type C4-dicarboxylate transport system substrate-binding protein